jgi:3-oxoacyl-[acyl-carrier protein] reductase
MPALPYTAIVSGGNTGIGAAIARGFLADGYDVISLSRRKPDWSHPRFISHEVDLLDAAATRQVASEIAANVPITHVVHNAGAIRAKLLEEVADEDVGALAQLHFGAGIALAQAALPSMKLASFGRIVLLSSRAALTWALELAPYGITVNVVAPGPIADTEMFESVMSPDSERAKKLAQSIPLGRLGKSDDVARAVSFFSSPDSDFITGQTLYVCGGASIGSISI